MFLLRILVWLKKGTEEPKSIVPSGGSRNASFQEEEVFTKNRVSFVVFHVVQLLLLAAGGLCGLPDPFA
ncbi:unnamed protein product [Brassica oleracea var. botrytis]|uniref:Uncharacterized protein n=2 Tax=Brassica TaxID=3705 RepID=A0A3P6EVF7_BRAOL|nr:unnamed protein product [Brassica napus]VDD35169.1 unnamed protein product [Brassica oleracea]